MLNERINLSTCKKQLFRIRPNAANNLKRKDLLQVNDTQSFPFEERAPSFRKKITGGVPDLPTNPLNVVNAKNYNSVLFQGLV